jgi:hypothetical protein
MITKSDVVNNELSQASVHVYAYVTNLELTIAAMQKSENREIEIPKGLDAIWKACNQDLAKFAYELLLNAGHYPKKLIGQQIEVPGYHLAQIYKLRCEIELIEKLIEHHQEHHAEEIAAENAGMLKNAQPKCSQRDYQVLRDELLAALEGVVRVADRATVEFDAARAAITKLKESN